MGWSAPSARITSCSSARSRSTARSARGQTSSSKPCTAARLRAMVSVNAWSAKQAWPCRPASSRRRRRMSRATSRLSCSPACSPRPVQARQTCSRRSRRVEKLRKGITSDRLKLTTCPCSPRETAACCAAARTKAGRPARAASSGSTRCQLDSSCSTFCAKRVVRRASSSMIWAWRARAAAGRRAPERTKARWVRSSSRCCSGLRPSSVRCKYRASMRAKSTASW